MLTLWPLPTVADGCRHVPGHFLHGPHEGRFLETISSHDHPTIERQIARLRDLLECVLVTQGAS